jgi:thiamine transport system substrate-binding protein
LVVKISKILPTAALIIGSMAVGLIIWSANKPMPKAKSNKQFRIAAYSSFTSSWGPGPSIVQSFEKKCGCQVVLEDFGDAGLLIQKMKMQKDQSPPDVILGFDRFSADEGVRELLWRDLSHLKAKFVFRKEASVDFGSTFFVPFDWAPIAFVYRKGEIDPPKSLMDLLDPRFKNAIALEDPRTSTPGMQFLDWIVATQSEQEIPGFLKKLRPNIHSVSPSWSTAYGLFKKKQAKIVLSYLTSPLYHLLAEKDSSFAAAVFRDGHAIQTEFAAIPEGCTSCERAEEFLDFLLQPESQAKLMELNYMLPATSPATGEFAKLPEVKAAPRTPFTRVQLIEFWKEVYRE